MYRLTSNFSLETLAARRERNTLWVSMDRYIFELVPHQTGIQVERKKSILLADILALRDFNSTGSLLKNHHISKWKESKKEEVMQYNK